MALEKPRVSAGIHQLSLMRVNDRVRTPAGREATVVAVNRDIGEATVRWDEDGESADFRIAALRRMPRRLS